MPPDIPKILSKRLRYPAVTLILYKDSLNDSERKHQILLAVLNNHLRFRILDDVGYSSHLGFLSKTYDLTADIRV